MDVEADDRGSFEESTAVAVVLLLLLSVETPWRALAMSISRGGELGEGGVLASERCIDQRRVGVLRGLMAISTRLDSDVTLLSSGVPTDEALLSIFSVLSILSALSALS